MKASSEDLLSASYQRRFLFVMFLVCFFNFTDRAVFAVLAEPIKKDLKLTDLEIGLLQGLSFALLYSVAGLPLGRLAEHHSRVKIVAAATAFWSLMTAACGFAGTFTHLMLARIGVGLGEAGFVPPTNSLVGDHFTRSRRASAMSVIMLGTPLGLAAGAVIGGVVGAFAGWRSAFLVLGFPGLIVALLVLLCLREPSRGLSEGLAVGKSPPPPFKHFLRKLRQSRALLWVIIGGSIAGFGMTAISQFLAIYLARVLHFSMRDAAGIYGMISGTSLAGGLLIGSFVTDRLSRYDRRWPAWGAVIGLLIAPVIYWFAFQAAVPSTAIILLILAGTILLFFYGPTSGMIQNLVEPRMRATASALFSMLYTLVGAGLGPTLLGGVSDVLAQRDFAAGDFAVSCPGGVAGPDAPKALADACLHASSAGVQQALLLSVTTFFVAAFAYWRASRTLAADMDAVTTA